MEKAYTTAIVLNAIASAILVCLVGCGPVDPTQGRQNNRAESTEESYRPWVLRCDTWRADGRFERCRTNDGGFINCWKDIPGFAGSYPDVIVHGSRCWLERE